MFRAIWRGWFGNAPRAGERYQFDEESNPFKDPWFVDVLEVRDGWVRYNYTGSEYSKNQSMKVGAFRFCFKIAPPSTGRHGD